MTVPVNPTSFLTLGMAGLIVWRMYSRMRRLIGRQQLSVKRSRTTVCLLPLVVLMLAFVCRAEPHSELALLGGLAIGAVLGVFGLRHTKFEETPAGLFYTPNAHIGVGLSLLLAGRILYRFVQMGSMEQTAPASPHFVSSPITLAIVGTLAGYYVTYAVGLLRRHSNPNTAPHAGLGE
jgi:hypothetical protein